MTGCLVLVAGPSGAGKDTLLAGARQALVGDPAFVFPRRVITRPADAGGEAHVARTPADFDEEERAGAFALSWRAHGLAYGIPGPIRADLVGGRHVVVNVSRGVIADARARFPRVATIIVTVPADVLADRLARRGRETPQDVAQRLERAAAIEVDGPDVHPLVNDGTIEEGVARFVALLRRITSC